LVLGATFAAFSQDRTPPAQQTQQVKPPANVQQPERHPAPTTNPQEPSEPKPPSEKKEDRTPVDLIWALKIPMRDGVRLNGTMFRSHEQKDPLPVIFTLTPYISDTYQARAMYFARHGYVFVLVDVRGRGNSEGTFDPFVQEPQDGHDVVEFLATQPWSNGKVTMWGGSYAGFDQWATAKELPPHLATIVPAAAAHAGVDFPFFHGVFSTYDMQWLTYTSGVTPNVNLFGEGSFWQEKAAEYYTKMAPYNTYDSIVGNTTTVFQKWLQHPLYDSFWKALAPTPQQYAAMHMPILTITGAYDGDQPGAMSYYREHMQFGSPEAKASHYLIIGPWDHAGTRTPNKEVGGLTFGDASMLDLNDLHRQWYDWTMKSGPKPEFLKKRIAYYVVGPDAEYWKYADSLDNIATESRRLLLSSDGHANDVFNSGAMRGEAPGNSSPDQWTYDPRDLRPLELEREPSPQYLTDQRNALNLFGNGAVYHSDPFPAATEISGYVRLTAFISADVPDTDFAVTLYEIMPDGKSIELTSDLMRARFRDSTERETPLTPGKITRFEFGGFTWFSRRVSKGSRLRLVITCPNTSSLEKNYNAGGKVESESGKDARVAHITIYHDAQHQSVLEIPVVR